jgi:hypothetical protein
VHFPVSVRFGITCVTDRHRYIVDEANKNKLFSFFKLSQTKTSKVAINEYG